MLSSRVWSVGPVISKPSDTIVNEGPILTAGFPLLPLWLLLCECLDDALKKGQWGGEAAYLGLCFLT